jgi:hypothetical protein
MTGRGKRGKPKGGFPLFPPPLEIAERFPHSHRPDDDVPFSPHEPPTPNNRKEPLLGLRHPGVTFRLIFQLEYAWRPRLSMALRNCRNRELRILRHGDIWRHDVDRTSKQSRREHEIDLQWRQARLMSAGRMKLVNRRRARSFLVAPNIFAAVRLASISEARRRPQGQSAYRGARYQSTTEPSSESYAVRYGRGSPTCAISLFSSMVMPRPGSVNKGR